MGIQQTIINFVQELLYFDIWEGFMFLSLFLIDNKLKINKQKFVFSIFMVGMLDYVASNLIPNALLRLMILIISVGIYLAFVFKKRILRSIIINGKNVFIFLILEALLDILYGHFINVEFLGLQNNFDKFKIMIPVKLLEFIFIIIYYKKKKGGEIHYEKSNKIHNN